MFLAYFVSILLFSYFNVLQHYFFSFILETLFICSLLSIAAEKKGILFRILLTVFGAIYSLVYSSQYCSIITTGNYLEVLTLENLSEFGSVGKSTLVINGLIFFVLFFLTQLSIYFNKFYLLMPVKYVCKFNTYKFKIVSSILLFLIFLSYNFFALVKSPTPALVSTCYSYFNLHFYTVDSSERERQKLLYGKTNICSGAKIDFIDQVNLKNNNVVSIFVEGFSDVIIHNSYQNLSNNIRNFESNSLTIKNYYNHTAATFRGIRGQLSSSYQQQGGYYADNSGIGQISASDLAERYKDTVISLADVLTLNLYHTYFIVPHSIDDNLANMVKTLGFEQVFGREQYSKYSGNDLSDKELLDFIGEIIKSGELKEPYYLGVYSVGTHIGKDSPDYTYGDGSNSYLNVFYNFDMQFGNFFADFKNSKLSDHSILILTSDHATYPSNQYMDTFKGNSGYFVDKIPFIIFKKGLTDNLSFSARIFDAENKNSLSYAPTILHLLSIYDCPFKIKNYFLGCSLFDKMCQSDFSHYSNLGSETFFTDDKVSKLNEIDAVTQKIFLYYNLSN